MSGWGKGTSWPRRLVAVTIASATLVAFAAAASASAGPPRAWTRLTEPTGTYTDEVAVARTPDGVLHVAWRRKDGDKTDLMHTAIATSGRLLGSPTPIASGWDSLGNAALVASPTGGLRAVFAGVRSGAPSKGPTLNTATSGKDGATWTLADSPIAPATTSAYPSPAAALERDGTLVTAWPASDELGRLDLHVGLDPAVGGQTLRTVCCSYESQLATDAFSGQVVLGWRLSTGHLLAQAVVPTGPRLVVPGSASREDADEQHAAISARIGAPGVYLAYVGGASILSPSRVQLWRYGGGAPLVVAKAPDAAHVAIGPGPQGRLWVMWADTAGGRIYAVRTNKAVTRVSPIVSTARPTKRSFVWKLSGDGANGPLDLFASVAPGADTRQAIATWHTQLQPPLTLTARLRKLASKRRLVLTVADAGDAVPGAMVRVAGKTPPGIARPKPRRSDAHGRVTFVLPAAQGTLHGSLSLTAAKTGYTSATTKVTLR